MTSTTGARPLSIPFDVADESSDEPRPLVFDDADEDRDERRDEDGDARLSAPLQRGAGSLLTMLALAVVALGSRTEGRWETIRYVVATR